MKKFIKTLGCFLMLFASLFIITACNEDDNTPTKQPLYEDVTLEEIYGQDIINALDSSKEPSCYTIRSKINTLGFIVYSDFSVDTEQEKFALVSYTDKDKIIVEESTYLTFENQELTTYMISLQDDNTYKKIKFPSSYTSLEDMLSNSSTSTSTLSLPDIDLSNIQSAEDLENALIDFLDGDEDTIQIFPIDNITVSAKKYRDGSKSIICNINYETFFETSSMKTTYEYIIKDQQLISINFESPVMSMSISIEYDSFDNTLVPSNLSEFETASMSIDFVNQNDNEQVTTLTLTKPTYTVAELVELLKDKLQLTDGELYLLDYFEWELDGAVEIELDFLQDEITIDGSSYYSSEIKYTIENPDEE